MEGVEVTRPIGILVSSILLSALVAFSGIALFPATTEAAAAQVRTCDGGEMTIRHAEKSMLIYHNRERAKRNKPELCIAPELQRAARLHAKDMIERDYFSHNTKGTGETFADRIEKQGYEYRRAAENIAYGTGREGSTTNTFQGWMDSSGHRSNLLNGHLREVGIGLYAGDYKGSPNARMWVADFGTPR